MTNFPLSKIDNPLLAEIVATLRTRPCWSAPALDTMLGLGSKYGLPGWTRSSIARARDTGKITGLQSAGRWVYVTDSIIDYLLAQQED